jgi:hypothetical protein
MPIAGKRHRRPRSAAAQRPKSMAGATGLEPATSGVTGRRSNQLSYAPAASTWAGTPTPPAGGCQASPSRSSRATRPERLPYDTSTSSSRRSTRSRRRSTLSSRLGIDAKSVFNAAKSPCRPATSRSTAARRVITSSSLRSTRVEALVLPSEAPSQEIENLAFLGHYSLIRSRCRAVVGDDGLEPPTLSV